MPDRDPGVFEIIYRYMNRETVLPLRKSACPKYLSYEQTERKLAEEAKFYRLTKLVKALPKPAADCQERGEVIDMQQQQHNGVNARDYTLQPPTVQQPPQQQYGIVAAGTGNISGSGAGVQPSSYAQPLQTYSQPPSIASQPSLQVPFQQLQQQQQQHQQQPYLAASGQPSQQLYSPAPTLPPTPMLHSAPARPLTAPSTPSVASSLPFRQTSSSHRSHSRQSSSSRNTVKPERKHQNDRPSVTAFLYRGEAAPRRGEAPFPLAGYPEDSPLPYLLVKAANAEIK